MASEATMTVIKMLETLPEQAQDRLAERLREYIEDIRDEALWNDSFSRTQANLVAAASRYERKLQKARRFQWISTNYEKTFIAME